uniref:Uncharacterized protein n=1 Tax=Trypanosoma congolense (strain IL3000) TaxID=1068625 RepID=G0UMI9_TRYCI|nr:hypothetical protein, unlikely [Trypanosoma congolense IL3000]
MYVYTYFSFFNFNLPSSLYSPYHTPLYSYSLTLTQLADGCLAQLPPCQLSGPTLTFASYGSVFFAPSFIRTLLHTSCRCLQLHSSIQSEKKEKERNFKQKRGREERN